MLSYGFNQTTLLREFGVDHRKISKIGFQFDPTDLRELERSDDGFVAITGGVSVQKGIGNLDAILSALKSDLKIKISFRTDELASLALNKFNLQKHVDSGRVRIVVGLEERADYLRFIASSRAIIIPSYYHTTGEFVMLEALFLGKPVHAFNVGVHKDMLNDSKNAMISEIHDFEDFSEKMDLIQTDEILRRELQRGAIKIAKHLVTQSKFDLFRDVFD